MNDMLNKSQKVSTTAPLMRQHYQDLQQTNKPESDYIEMIDGQDNKYPQWMDIPESIHSTKQANEVTMQDNPAYSITSDNRVEIQDNSVISTSSVMVTFTIFNEEK